MVGPAFTWSNSSFGASRVECKLDRVFGNQSFFQSSLCLNFEVLNPILSDHSPMLITSIAGAKHPFKFFNAQAREKDFFATVRTAWTKEVKGTPMFRVVKKLVQVKRALSKWCKESLLSASALKTQESSQTDCNLGSGLIVMIPSLLGLKNQLEKMWKTYFGLRKA